MEGILTAIWVKWREFKHEYIKNTITALISPALYIIAFGWGLDAGNLVNGEPYIKYLIPGVIALTTMNIGYSTTASPLCLQRIYEKSFQQIIISPTPMWQYVTGIVIAGGFRGVYSGLWVIVLALIAKVDLNVNFAFVLIMMLNSMTFSALGVTAAVYAKNHMDTSRFSTYVILPMTFLCNTFFSIDKMPVVIKEIISLLPLTHASTALRNIAFASNNVAMNSLVLLGYLLLCLALAFRGMEKKKDL